MSEIQERYTAVLQKIARAAEGAGRSPDEITLVAVTKTWPAETIVAAYKAGLRHFGENRAEELAEKRPLVTAQLGSDSGIVWHFIGALQSRKTKLVAEHADVFHALDRLKIANRLAAQRAEYGLAPLPTFIEVNVSGEASKAGFDCTRWEESATQQQKIRTVVQTVCDSPALTLAGLMTMAPWEAPPHEIMTIFQRTRRLAAWLQAEMGRQRPLQLSMGMTDDFELAIAAGATHVRIGRALFGERTAH